MSHALDITMIVDVIRALSNESLEGAVYMMDTNLKSKHHGTGRLVTVCHPGQMINWRVRAVDVQTQVKIRSIGLLREEDCRLFGGECGGADDHWWSGRVMLPEGRYRYVIELQLGNGQHSVQTLDGPVLSVRARHHGSHSRQPVVCWEVPAFYPPYWPYASCPPYAGYCPPYPPPPPFYPPPVPYYPWDPCWEGRWESHWDPCNPWDDWDDPCLDRRRHDGPPLSLKGRVGEG